MKTRIKVVTLVNGTNLYYPQYKWCWLWWDIPDEWGDTHSHALYFAQRRIDDLLESIEKKKSRKKVSTEYIKYP